MKRRGAIDWPVFWQIIGGFALILLLLVGGRSLRNEPKNSTPTVLKAVRQ